MAWLAAGSNYVSSEWFKLPDDVITTLCECEGEHDLLALCGAFVA